MASQTLVVPASAEVRPSAIKAPSVYSRSVAVALTAYNDEEAVAFDTAAFRAMGIDNVIVVDNNSKDRTAEVAEGLGARVVRETRQGYGFACMRGLREAYNSGAEIIVLCEGDGTFYAEDITKFLAYLDHVDMAVGTRCRYTLTSADSQMDPFFVHGNKFIAWLLQLRSLNFRFWSRYSFTDVGCTYRAIRREALGRILDQLKVGDHHFSPHMLLVAMKNDLRVVEIPVRFRRRIGVSKGASGNKWKAFKIGLKMIGHVLFYNPGTTGVTQVTPGATNSVAE